MKIQFELEDVTGRQFEGYVLSQDLKDWQLLKLGYSRKDAPKQIDCGGEYTVVWDQDIGAAAIDLVYAYSHKDEKRFNILDFDLSELDIPTIERQIENLANMQEWFNDKLSSDEDQTWDKE